MAGTKLGGQRASKTNKEKYGKDFYQKLGKLGGSVSGVPKGFAANIDLASRAGKKGWRVAHGVYAEDIKK